MVKRILLIIIIFQIFISTKTFAEVNFSLVNINESLINLSYDREIYNNENLTGSFSYRDNSIRNQNAFIKICNISENFTNSFLDFLYSSESGNITISLLSLLPSIFEIRNDSCALVDIDISAFKALYPAIPFIAIYKYFINETTNETTQETIFFKKMNETFLLGNYSLGVDIDDILKETYLTIEKIFDDRNESIDDPRGEYLIISIVFDNISVQEKITSPKKRTTFKYMFKSNESVFVNGILSLKVRAVEPCAIINETGFYYILNSSKWNTNESCIIVENTKNIVIDFANKTIDGDKYINGSLREDVCGVIIRNVENISLKDVRVQEFYRGVCIINSSNVKIFGTSAQSNIEGIYSEESYFKIYNIKIVNDRGEVNLSKNSIAEIYLVYFDNATITAKTKDTFIKYVKNPPPDPKDLYNISQWINITKNQEDSWLKNITFHFEFPNPQKVIPKEIYRIDGELENNTWINLSYEKLENVYLDMDKRIIFSLTNLTNFSIFAPYGEKVNITEPEPVPEPVPQPVPQPTPSEVPGVEEIAQPPRVNLTLINKSITLQQGEIGHVLFNITNIGRGNVRNIRVLPIVRRGWNNSFVDISLLRVNETKEDSVLISIYENEIPGTYYIPVVAILKDTNTTLDLEMLEVIVIPRKRVARLSILEFTPFLSLPEHSRVEISILVKNTGDFDLQNITLKIKNGENCIEGIEGSYNLNVTQEALLNYVLYTKGAKNTCETIFILESDRGVVALYPVIIEIKEHLVSRGIFYFIRILPLLVLIWTIITIRTMMTTRSLRKKEEVEHV